MILQGVWNVKRFYPGDIVCVVNCKCKRVIKRIQGVNMKLLALKSIVNILEFVVINGVALLQWSSF